MTTHESRVMRNLVKLAFMLLILAGYGTAFAHGFAGERFFPATLTFDDPFTQDEFDLLYSAVPNAKGDSGGSMHIHSLQFEYAKSITPGMALSVGSAYQDYRFDNGNAQHGYDNITLSAKSMGAVNAQSESSWSYGLDADIGGTSSHGIGEAYSVISPSLYFAKGLGNLPNSASYLRPLAITGKISIELPDRGDHSRKLDTAFSVQYSLTYLESFVKSMGLPPLLRNSVLLIEIPLQTCMDYGCGGDMTGTINPGIIFFNRFGQVSLEAVVPANDRSGNAIGGMLQVHFYLDDIFPNYLGKPLFL